MELPKEKLLVFVIVFVVANIDYNSASSNRDGERGRRPSRSLSAEVVNSTTITLKWPKAAASAAAASQGQETSPSCPVKRYLIRLKNQAMKRVRTWEVDGEKQSVSFHGLLPDTTYSVRLMVVNCEGRSKPSRWVSVRTSDQPTSYRIRPDGSAATDHRASETTAPGQPRKVTSRAFSDYVIVSWEPPADDVEVRGYVIGYGEGVPDVNWQYLEGHRRNVTVKNLKKSTQYVISVRAFNNIGKGPVVYDLVYTRDNRSQESGSMPAPTHLRSKVLSHTTVWLQWTDPSLGRQPTVTDNRYYSVHYQPLSGTGNDRSVVVKDLHVVLYNLHPATAYEFKVGLVKDGLTSAFSDVIVNRTLETAPFSPPRSVTVTRLSSDPSTVVVNWRPPKQPNGNITDYTVFYTQNVELPYDRWQTETVRRKTDVALQGLSENVTYYFRVHARNSVGPGPKSDIVKFDSKTIMPNVAPSATRAPSSSSIRVSTNGDASGHHVILPHVIAVNDTDAEDEYDYNTDNNNNNNPNNNNKGEEENEEGDDKDGGSIQGASLVHETGDKKTKREPNLGPIVPGSTAEPAWDLDGGPHRQPQPHPHPQGPFVQFRSVLSHRISAYITWPESTLDAACPLPSSAPSRRGVTGYRLRYRRADDDAGEYVARTLAENVALIENLAPNVKYRYQVQYQYGTAESPWSQEQELDTGAGGKTD